MKYNYNDGGRAAAGFKGTTGDCFCRAVAIAAERPYKEVYDLINEYAKSERKSKRRRGKSNARTGTYRVTEEKVMAHYGFEWVPTMQIGQGCTTHLREDELPKGRIVCQVTKHMVAVIDGVINDIYDPSRDGTRCVYGYYRKADGTPVLKAEHKDYRKYKVVYEFLAPSGRWVQDYLNNNEDGFTVDDADHIVADFRTRTDCIRNVRKVLFAKH